MCRRNTAQDHLSVIGIILVLIALDVAHLAMWLSNYAPLPAWASVLWTVLSVVATVVLLIDAKAQVRP